MAATRRGAADPLAGARGHDPHSPAGRLFTEGYAFDFFQAVRLLQWMRPDRQSVGRSGPPSAEVVRFRANTSLNFPPSAIYEITPPADDHSYSILTQSFFGLTGVNGALPRHYTEMILRLEKEHRGPERRALRDWLDLFNHRLVSLFYRAWEKYRFFLPYERAAFDRLEPDSFTLGLLSLVGLGTPALRDRLRVTGPARTVGGTRPTLARIDDLALLYYGGLLAHRPRSAVGLQALLQDYFRLEVRVHQFEGFWLRLEPSNMTRLGVDGGNNQLGVNALIGDRVWDVQSKIRVTIGPLNLEKFDAFLPAGGDAVGRNALSLVAQLTRFYVGPELDFDVQLILRADEVPECRLPSGGEEGPALGWSSWLHSQPFETDAADAVFPGQAGSRSYS